MKSRVVSLPAGVPAAGSLERLADGGDGDTDLVLAFLPPDPDLPATLAALARRFPGALRAGCEAVTQFAGDGLTTGGALHLFRFEGDGAGAEVLTLAGDADAPGAEERTGRLADHLAAGAPALLLADGLRCPVQDHLERLRSALSERTGAPCPGLPAVRPVGGGLRLPPPLLAGGLASQALPPTVGGARVFSGDGVAEGGCIALLLHGVDATVRVVRGWDPASPVYRVTRARGRVLQEIDGEPATDWYRRFFTVGGELAPMPETAHHFPLILEGPDPSRDGLYRSMKSFDDPPGTVTFWGDLETGDRVRLGMGNEASLVDKAVAGLAGRGGDRPEAAVLYSCVGRQVVLGAAAGNEVRAVHRALGGVPLSGFFSFGEIGPTEAGGPAFYNHTAILVLLAEGRANGAGAEAATGGGS